MRARPETDHEGAEVAAEAPTLVAPLLAALLFVIAFAIVVLDHRRPWPVNGRVINDCAREVTVWSSDRGLHFIAPHSTSDRFWDDVDHVQSPLDQSWFKIGVHTAHLHPDGTIDGFECRVSTFGSRCGE